jgi:hypothetical protein
MALAGSIKASRRAVGTSFRETTTDKPQNGSVPALAQVARCICRAHRLREIAMAHMPAQTDAPTRADILS